MTNSNAATIRRRNGGNATLHKRERLICGLDESCLRRSIHLHRNPQDRLLRPIAPASIHVACSGGLTSPMAGPNWRRRVAQSRPPWPVGRFVALVRLSRRLPKSNVGTTSSLSISSGHRWTMTGAFSCGAYFLALAHPALCPATILANPAALIFSTQAK
jgi:hypothetical protein